VANPESNGRFHSDWLSMISPRVKLARNLLRDDGYIVVSIDDEEFHNLRNLMNEIFGEDNFVATLCWDKNRKNDAKLFSVGHEYMIVFAKSLQTLRDLDTKLREPREGIEEARELYNDLSAKFGSDLLAIEGEWRNFYNRISKSDPRKKIGRYSKIGPDGPYRDDGDISWPGGGGPKYEILHPETQKPCKVPKGGWCYGSATRFWEEYDKGRIAFGPDETTLPRQTRSLFSGEGIVMPSVFYSYAQTATVEFVELMGARVFDNPKNWKDLKRLVRYLTGPSDTVLDFFAGASGTAHAVIAQNAVDKGKRRFIEVQLPEEIEEDTAAHKAGYRTIADLSRDRIKRAADSLKEVSEEDDSDLDAGFRSFRIASSNFSDTRVTTKEATQEALAGMVSHIKEDRSEEDLLFGALLRWGVDITSPIEQHELAGRKVWLVDPPADGDTSAALIACFARPQNGKGGIDTALADAMAELAPLRVLFRDDGFADDATKENVHSRFQQRAPDTQVRVL